MKILLINKYHFLKGGAERAYFDMARMLEAKGHTVAFFSMRHPLNQATVWEKYFVDGIDYQDSTLSLRQKIALAGKLLFNFDAKKRLDALLSDFQPDIAHVHNIYHQLSPSIFWPLRKRGIPIVMTLHDYKLVSPNYSLFVRGSVWEHSSGLRCITDRCVKDSFGKSLLCAAEKWLHTMLGSYEKVDRFIAPSRFLIEKYRDLGFRREISPLPNPLAPLKEPQKKVAKEEGTLLYFGRLSPEKGADLAIEALAHLPEKHTLWIVGDGPERKRLELLARKTNLLSRVTFFGAKYDEALEDLKQRAEAIVIPSRWYENFPYTLIESLQSGCIVIASDIGGMRERITPGVSGLLFRAGDAAALAETILSLEIRPLAQMRERARTSVMDLNEAAFLGTLLPLYEHLIRESLAKRGEEV